MHPSPDSPTAVVLLPPVRGRLGDRTLSRWLSQGRLQEVPAPVDPFTQILGELGQERPPEGLAALRMWGQTGDRPGSWIAGADPVYMEPRLDRLFLHVLGPGDASRSELRRVFLEKVREFAESLNERDRQIVEERILADEPRTLQELGKEFDVSRERIRQLEARLVSRLRDFLKENLVDFEYYAVPKD